MISTRNKNDKRSVIDSILSGMSTDGGLWIPEKIPEVSLDWINKLDKLTIHQICSHIMKLYFSPDISESIIDNIVEKAINFEIPLVKLDHNDYILELFHGPTVAFKDFGARVMALLFQHIITMKMKIIVLLYLLLEILVLRLRMLLVIRIYQYIYFSLRVKYRHFKRNKLHLVGTILIAFL